MAQSVEQRFRKPQVEGSSPSVGSLFRGVAQFGSAFGSGPKGRGFESRHFDMIWCNLQPDCTDFFVLGGVIHSLFNPWGKLGGNGLSVRRWCVELLQGTEEEVYGDSGYLGAEKEDDTVLVNNERKPVRYQINKRPSQLKKASGEKFELLKAIEHAKSSVRSKVEHVFCVIKRTFHFCKTRYRGREKLHQHCCTLFALANLYLARNRMKVA